MMFNLIKMFSSSYKSMSAFALHTSTLGIALPPITHFWFMLFLPFLYISILHFCKEFSYV